MLVIKNKNNDKIKANSQKKEIKIVFSDIDGTLLNNEHKLSKLNLEALIKAKEKGVKVVFATGRPFHSAENVLSEVKKHDINFIPGIYLNGCVTFSPNGEKVINNYLNKELVSNIYNFCLKEDILKYVVWYSIDNTYCFNTNDNINNYINLEGLPPTIIKKEDLEVSIIYKVLICADNSNFDIIFKKCKNNFTPMINISNAYSTYIELYQKSSKFEGIKEICKYYKLGLDNVLVIGDGENDIEMLEGVFSSVTPSNAPEKVKKYAKYIAPSNDNNTIHHVLQTFCSI
ncbi:haloacid dehalogenase-like hydrolase [Hepatocystis sp. ex Piliocolobus tephrosceles]|nr:haloacid dehalogenase-like hydrolase [Hepatocystis sp. ex Piliocolobus tephrosceles]